MVPKWIWPQMAIDVNVVIHPEPTHHEGALLIRARYTIHTNSKAEWVIPLDKIWHTCNQS